MTFFNILSQTAMTGNRLGQVKSLMEKNRQIPKM